MPFHLNKSKKFYLLQPVPRKSRLIVSGAQWHVRSLKWLALTTVQLLSNFTPYLVLKLSFWGFIFLSVYEWGIRIGASTVPNTENHSILKKNIIMNVKHVLTRTHRKITAYSDIFAGGIKSEHNKLQRNHQKIKNLIWKEIIYEGTQAI